MGGDIDSISCYHTNQDAFGTIVSVICAVLCSPATCLSSAEKGEGREGVTGSSPVGWRQRLGRKGKRLLCCNFLLRFVTILMSPVRIFDIPPSGVAAGQRKFRRRGHRGLPFKI